MLVIIKTIIQILSNWGKTAMSTDELVSGVLEGLKLNALDLSALFRTALLILAGGVVTRVLLRFVVRLLS